MPRKIKQPAHIRYVPVSGCGEKMRYKTKKLADDAARLGELRDFSLQLDTYQCPWCHAWHLTSVKDTHQP